MARPLRDMLVTSSDHRDVREAVRALNGSFPAEYWADKEKRHEFPREYFDAFAAAGWTSMMAPTEYGGGGATLGETCAMLEEVAAGIGGAAACTAVHLPSIAMGTIIKHGSPELQAKYLDPIVKGELIVSFGVTEPNAGTDTSRITTFARRDGDRYIVNGQKVWNSGAQEAGKVLLLARTSLRGENGARPTDGMSTFMADLHAPTVDIRPIAKIGRHAVDSNELYFTDHPVEASDLIGVEGEGFRQILHSLNSERVIVAAECVGNGRRCLEWAIDYSNSRIVFDRPISKNQSIQHPLTRAFVDLHAASLAVREAAAAYDAGAPSKEVGFLANAAKLLASEAAFKAADAAMQAFGGYSFALEYNIGRAFIESRLPRVGPVSNELVLNNIGQSVLGFPRSY